MRGIRYLAVLVALIFSAGARAQVATGLPPFGSFGGGAFDKINNANLDVHFQIPVVAKAGRGLPFYYLLSYDSSVWYPSASSGTNTWTPVANWGWTGITSAATGYVSYDEQTWMCYNEVYPFLDYHVFQNWVYHDSSGGIHSFPITVSDAADVGNGTGCDPAQGPYPPEYDTATAADGSGYTMLASAYYGAPAATVYSPSGTTINPPLQSGGGAGSLYDSNGNELSTNGSAFTDTLGTTALTVSGSGTPTSPYAFTYTAASGQAASVTLNYTAYTVQTAFGCTGTNAPADYGPTTQNLVSSITLPDGTSYSVTYEATPGNPSNITGRIASITLPTGGTISYAYSGGSNGITCADGSTAGLTRTTPDGVWTYSRQNIAGAEWKTTAQDPQNNYTYLYFQGIYETERQVAGLETVDTCYNGAAIPCTGTAITLPITQRTVKTSIGGLTAETNTTYNTYGLPTDVKEYDYGLTLLRDTAIAYNTTLGNNIFDRPSSVTVYKSDGVTVAAQTTFAYDQTAVTATSGTPQHVSLSGSRGNLTSVASGGLTRSFSYYDTGMVYTATDVNGAQTSYTYGACGNSFPTLVSLPMSLSTSETWDCNGGVPLSSTDANNQGTSFSYDIMNRLTSSSFPGGGLVTTSYPSATERDISTALTGTTSRQDQILLDSLGRMIHQNLLSDPAGADIVDTAYNSVGLTASVSNPYRGTSNGGDSYTYDALGRGTSVMHADGNVTSTSYSGNCATTTDPAGKARQTCSDALGRVVKVIEDPGSSPHLNYETDYQYDALDDLLTVTQGSQTRTYQYDSLGRLTSATTPESGTTTYSYNASGDLYQRTDARNITTSYTYDALHRLTGKSYNDNPQTPGASYYYDQTSYNGLTISNGKGRRTGMSDGSGVTAWSYDAMGRVGAQRQTISVATKTFYYSYNLAGGISSLTYPTGRVVNYTYDGGGRPVSVVDLVTGVNYALNASYAPFGGLRSVVNGQGGSFGGITSSLTYNNRLWASALTASSTNGTVLDLGYSYLGNGAVSAVVNNRDNTRNETLGYDSLNRLTEAWAGASSRVWDQTFGYDRWGNVQCGVGSTPSCPAPSYDYASNRIVSFGGGGAAGVGGRDGERLGER